MTARLVSSAEIAPEVRHFEFDVPGVPSLSYLAGQFLSFTEEIGGKRITRAYSVASAPSGNRFELCLNRVKEGHLSPYLFRMNPGDTIEFGGPYGVFTPRTPLSDSLLVATGTGVAPFRAMIQTLLPPETDHRFHLLWGVRNEESILYRTEFEALAARYPSFRFQPTLSRPDWKWTGSVGRVQAHLPDAMGDRRDIDVYICGLKAMVDDVRARLRMAGLERRRIIYEKYD